MPKKVAKNKRPKKAALRARKVKKGPVKRAKRTQPGFFSKVAGMVGSALGGDALGMVGKAISTITGMGAYHIKKNSLASGPPTFPRDGSTIISHREFLTDVKSGASTSGGLTTFDIFSYSLNPGSQVTFPWLADIASNFEQYEFLGLAFEFKSTSSTALNSTNTALGTVILATDYNAAAVSFGNKQQMEVYQGAVSGNPSQSLLHLVECAPNSKVLHDQYVRTATLPAGQDLQFYDLGNFQIATVGMQATSVTIGELWVTYHVRLTKPRLFGGLAAVTDHFSLVGLTTSLPLGASQIKQDTSLGGSVTSTTYTSPVLPAGTQLLLLYTAQAGTSCSGANYSGLVNCSLANYWSGAAGTEAFANYVATNTGTGVTMLAQVLNMTKAGTCSVSLTAGTVVGTANGDLIVTYVGQPASPYQLKLESKERDAEIEAAVERALLKLRVEEKQVQDRFEIITAPPSTPDVRMCPVGSAASAAAAAAASTTVPPKGGWLFTKS